MMLEPMQLIQMSQSGGLNTRTLTRDKVIIVNMTLMTNITMTINLETTKLKLAHQISGVGPIVGSAATVVH